MHPSYLEHAAKAVLRARLKHTWRNRELPEGFEIAQAVEQQYALSHIREEAEAIALAVLDKCPCQDR